MNNLKYPVIMIVCLISLNSFHVTNDVGALGKVGPSIQNKPISFIENSFTTALKKAKAEHKYIFVDAYATWCGPCKQLKNTTFKNSQTSEFFNKNFVNLSLDMEKGEGVKLAEAWGIEEYPTLLILDQNGKILNRSIGYVDAKQLTVFGKNTLLKQ